MPRRPLDPKCRMVCDQMFLIATNELSDAEAKVAFSHMADCPKCRRALAEHVKLAAAMFGTMNSQAHKMA